MSRLFDSSTRWAPFDCGIAKLGLVGHAAKHSNVTAAGDDRETDESVGAADCVSTTSANSVNSEGPPQA